MTDVDETLFTDKLNWSLSVMAMVMRVVSDVEPRRPKGEWVRPSLTSSAKLPLRVSESIRPFLRCPRCRGGLVDTDTSLCCEVCCAVYPVADGTPVLIDEASSVFRHAAVVAHQATTLRPAHGWRKTVKRWLPSIDSNPLRDVYREQFLQAIQNRPDEIRILMIGRGRDTDGRDWLAGIPHAEVIDSDVTLVHGAALACDAHRLPFADNSLDAITLWAVLEHVLDPHQVVAEVHRVLKPDGIVFASTPFMQPVHMGAYDFTRWTPLGHRRLFRRFTTIAAGPAGGQGMMLAWAWQYWLMGFVPKNVAEVIARISGRWLLWFDRRLATHPSTWDSSKGSYFIGGKSDIALDDLELLAEYRGLM